jgi:hypothetical protein
MQCLNPTQYKQLSKFKSRTKNLILKILFGNANKKKLFEKNVRKSEQKFYFEKNCSGIIVLDCAMVKREKGRGEAFRLAQCDNL